MRRPGQSFEDAEVATYYAYRPPYPDEIATKLVELSPAHRSLMDLGCGTGKIARTLSSHFQSVFALDASAAMLEVAQQLENGRADNIHWVQGLAETTELEHVPYDLVVAAASIHWMDHAVVFPRLAASVSNDHLFAVVEGDGAFDPPWQSQWEDFLTHWIRELTGETYGRKGNESFENHMRLYQNWIDVAGEVSVISKPVAQSIPDFVACQHSRDTFAPSKLGRRLEKFDSDLARLLRPFAAEDQLTYCVQTKLTWGSIKV